MKGAVHIGTSGWSYEHWKGRFYSRRLRSRDMLGHYVKSFRTAEINSSFYRLPAVATLESWYDTTPPGFVFAAKASRYITHMKKLNDPKASTAAFFARMRMLGDKLGPILFQLPPHWSFNESRLAAFLEALADEFRCAFEFRDHGWFNDRAFELLAEHSVVRAGAQYLLLFRQRRGRLCRPQCAAVASDAQARGHEQVARYEEAPGEIAGAEATGFAVRDERQARQQKRGYDEGGAGDESRQSKACEAGRRR
jgi:uncharacterized protein YecE (DUF72 family)